MPALDRRRSGGRVGGVRKLIAAMSVALLMAGCGEKVGSKIQKAKESGATKLDLFRNEISDITPLEGLTNLIVLSLNNNKISDVTPLTELTSLMLLGLDENPIPTDQKAMLRKALPECEIIF